MCPLSCGLFYFYMKTQKDKLINYKDSSLISSTPSRSMEWIKLIWGSIGSTHIMRCIYLYNTHCQVTSIKCEP